VKLVTQFSIFEPRLGEFLLAVCHVFSAEDSQLEHFRRSQIRLELGIEVLANRLRQKVDVIRLHQVIDDDFFSSHKEN
jgi:hypothetical protein